MFYIVVYVTCKQQIFGPTDAIVSLISLYIWFMEKVLKIVSLKDKNTDFDYWKKQSEIQRLMAIETLRQQYINFKQDVQPGLQRVYRIVNKTQS